MSYLIFTGFQTQSISMEKQYFDNGRLKKVFSRFGRQNKKQVTINYWESCTYLHIRNLKNDKVISLGIDEYEELCELLMDDLKRTDKLFRKQVSQFFLQDSKNTVCFEFYMLFIFLCF